jgi:hypothetical protein
MGYPAHFLFMFFGGPKLRHRGQRDTEVYADYFLHLDAGA